jgi:predicted RNase H-like HicB family nuclease
MVCFSRRGKSFERLSATSLDQSLNPLRTQKDPDMFCEYIHAALSKATYEIIEDEEPFYGEVPELRGVWAIGKTLEECRENLKGVIEGWIALRLRLGLAIPPIGGHTIEIPTRAEAVV